MRLKAVFSRDEHVEAEATWGIYQHITATYRHPDRGAGNKDLQAAIRSRTKEVPPELTEMITLGRASATIRTFEGSSDIRWPHPITPQMSEEPVKDVFFSVCGELKGLPDSMNATYLEVIVQVCIIA